MLVQHNYLEIYSYTVILSHIIKSYMGIDATSSSWPSFLAQKHDQDLLPYAQVEMSAALIDANLCIFYGSFC